MLAEALVAGRFSRVQALVAEPLASTVRAFQPVTQAGLSGGSTAVAPTAVIVLERERRSNGRDEAFVQPAPAELLPLARRVHAAGVRCLLVVAPHARVPLPQALSHGLASLDEAAAAALGFEHLVLLRAAQAAGLPAHGSPLQRFARWWLSQLSSMVPQRQQPLPAAALARCVVQLARLLPALPALPGGSRVIAPETLRLWARDEAGLAATLARELGAAGPARPGMGPPP